MFQSLAAKLADYKNKFGKKNSDEAVATQENAPYQPEENVAPENDVFQSVDNGETQTSSEMDPAFAENMQNFDQQPQKKMSLGKILLILFLLLVLGGAGAAYYYISTIDWNQHKDKIAAEFSNFTGKRIVFNGPVHLTFLPAPKLKAEDIKIYNPGEDLDEPLAQIKSLEADLTLNSLLNGDFDVKMMSLKEPDIRLELLENNQLNWDTPLTDAQRANLENMEITLDSVLVQNATIHWIDDIRKKNYTINNINAEVIAQSIFGPYRIEGTYVKNNHPEGFAFSIGKMTSGLSTSVNAVINQPSTETFVRFDGSVMPQNSAINGNLIFESKKLMDFINSNSDKFKLKSEYDYPLAITLELKSNKQKIEITNFAVKYGDSAGAGNVLIPLSAGDYDVSKNDKSFRSKVEFGFNFTTLDLQPISKVFQELWNKYKTGTAAYNPQMDFDLLADVKAIKAVYNNQNVKDLKVSLDILNNKIIIRDFQAVLPGDADVSVKGDIFSDLGKLNFNLEPTLKTDEFRQTLNWLGIVPQSTKDTLLRRINAHAKVMGNFNKTSISGINLTLDNSIISGELGIINDKKFNIYAALKTNIFNIDDYFPEMVINQVDKSWADNINARFQKINISPDVYAELRLNADTLLYNSLPYSGVSLNGNLQQGVLQLTSFNIENMAGSKFELKGKIKGFGKKAEAENLKYSLTTQNFNELVSQMNISLPNIDMKKFNNFKVSGIVTGFPDYFATKSIAKLENIDIDFGGKAEQKNGVWEVNGLLDVRSPDFVKMVNDFNFHYDPKTYVLGMFNMHANVSGNWQKFVASDLIFNIGSNAFSGKIVYDETQEKPNIIADIAANRFELDKFFYNNAKVKASQNASFKPQRPDKIDFLARPFFDSEKFNFEFLNAFALTGKFNVSRLIYKDWNFDYCHFDVNSDGKNLSVSNFEADYQGGKIRTAFDLSLLPDNPTIRGNVSLENIEMAEKNFGGAQYGLKNGTLTLSARFLTSAQSFADMYENLNSEGKFSFANAIVKGWNIQDIYQDLLNRKTSQGLNAFVKSKLVSGEEKIASGQGRFFINNGRFTIDESLWNGEGFTTTFKADALLRNWEGESVFDIDFLNPDYLPNFGISYSGALDNPELNVNIENLAIMYNQRQKEIQEQEAAEQAAIKAQRRKNLDNSLLKTKAMNSEIETVIRPDLDLKKQKAVMPDAETFYTNFEQRLAKIEADLAELMLIAQNPDISEDMIKDVDERNARNQKYLDDMKAEMQRVSLENLKYSFTQTYNQILQKQDEARQYDEDYKKQKQELEKRIANIETSYVLEEDENFKRLKDALQGQILALTKIAEKVVSDYQNADTTNEFELEKSVRTIRALEQDINRYLSEIKNSYTQLFDYANERVKIAEEAYDKKKREEALKKKVEENTGTISVKGTGVSKTFVQNLDDIKATEEALKQQSLETSSSAQKVEPPLQQNKEEKSDAPIVRREGGLVRQSENAQNNLVKKADGKISKATGVIIRK